MHEHWTSHLTEQTPYPVFVSIQPNTAHGAPLLVRPNPGDNTPEASIWAMTGALLYHLDKLRSGCANPGMLGRRDRLQGYVVLEALDGNIHPHLLITNASHLDQILTGLFLFEHLDTASRKRKDPRDEAWQNDAWDFLQRRNGTGFRKRNSSPLLRHFAPGATAMVQLIRAASDRERVNQYFTKELYRSTLSLAYASSYWSNRSDLRIRELAEFHSRVGYNQPAKRIRIDPNTGSQTLDLDAQFPWKHKGRRIH